MYTEERKKFMRGRTVEVLRLSIESQERHIKNCEAEIKSAREKIAFCKELIAEKNKPKAGDIYRGKLYPTERLFVLGRDAAAVALFGAAHTGRNRPIADDEFVVIGLKGAGQVTGIYVSKLALNAYDKE